ncbi:hypothetical protein BU15DRAFT_75631 [Melanogaster broomeanus]|nr:hypothetical protein BU15DRAFT_75631 [Melanogaster broomeanus]
MATVEDDLWKNPFKLQQSTMEDIRAIANTRFNEMIEDAPNDTYIVAFFLNPAYRTAPIYKDNNPLAIPTITISKKGGTPKCTTKVPADLLQRVGVSLQKMLRHEFGDAFTNTDWKTPQKQMQLQNPLLSKYHPADALTRLKDQLKAYAKGIDPFNRPIRTKTESTVDWWAGVQKDTDADVLGALALKIFSAVPTSIVDERTMSTITWLNASRRSSQHVSTLQDHIKIRQWHRYKPENDKPPFKPVVHWRDVDATVLSHKRKASQLGEDPPAIGCAPPQPQLFESPAESDDDLDCEGEFGSSDTTGLAADSDGTAGVPVDDGARWLDKKRGLSGRAIHAERQRLALAGVSELELSSPFFCDILDESPSHGSRHLSSPGLLRLSPGYNSGRGSVEITGVPV